MTPPNASAQQDQLLAQQRHPLITWCGPYGSEIDGSIAIDPALGYECSSIGDKRFSAFHARVTSARLGQPADYRTIEQIYQCDVKGYEPGGVNWVLGKGKPPLLPLSQNELWDAYLGLWIRWGKANPDWLHQLRQLAGRYNNHLTDQFATSPVNQAHALATILNTPSLLISQE